MSIDEIIKQMRQSPHNLDFKELVKVCKEKFGEPRQVGSSHVIFKMPWLGDPRINRVVGLKKIFKYQYVNSIVLRLK